MPLINNQLKALKKTILPKNYAFGLFIHQIEDFSGHEHPGQEIFTVDD